MFAVVGTLEFQALHPFQQTARLGLGIFLMAFHAETEAGQFLGRWQAAERVIIAYKVAGRTDADDGVSPGCHSIPTMGDVGGNTASTAEAAEGRHLALAEVCQHALMACGILQVGIIWGPRDWILLWRKDIELFKPGPPFAVPLESPFATYCTGFILIRILTLQRQKGAMRTLGLTISKGWGTS